MGAITRTPLRVRHEVRLRLAQVATVEDLTPRMRRVVLAGDALEGFASAAADDHVKLFLPQPGQEQPVLPQLGADGMMFADGAIRPTIRDYTPRRFDAATRQLTLEFVLHGDGPAAAWARQARPGQWIGVGGPRGSLLIPEDYDAYLLAGDETALPAIARRLEEMHPGARAIVLIEVEGPAEERDLPTAANASISWLPRNGQPAGRNRVLLDALRSARLPAGDIHAWLAGEIDTTRALRTHLVEQRQIPRAQVKAAGYWRVGEPDSHGRIED